jgi:hypothetical protein
VLSGDGNTALTGTGLEIYPRGLRGASLFARSLGGTWSQQRNGARPRPHHLVQRLLKHRAGPASSDVATTSRASVPRTTTAFAALLTLPWVE